MIGVARFERFFRGAAGLDVDKNDVKRLEEYVNRKVYDLLVVAQRAAGANGRDVGVDVEERLPEIVSGLSLAVARALRIIEPDLTKPSTVHWQRAFRLFDLLP